MLNETRDVKVNGGTKQVFKLSDPTKSCCYRVYVNH